MVQNLVVNYVFKYPFELVAKAYFNKYSSGFDENVKEVVIVEQRKDFVSGVNYYKRQGKCVNLTPSFLKIFFSEPIVYFEEEIWFNRREQIMSMYTRNMTYAEIVTLEERSVYKVSAENPQWTSFEQEGTIKVNGIGPILNTMAEKCAAILLSKGGKKGLNIMEDLLRHLRRVES